MKFPLNLYTAHQVRALDQIAINAFDLSGIVLMERAGLATFKIIQKTYPKIQNLHVFCGSGNNGGDGYIVATLAIKAGFSIVLVAPPEVDLIRADALLARQSFLESGGKESVYSAKSIDILNSAADSSIIVDAIFGTGLSRDIEGYWKEVINAINKSPAKVVSIDIPSGLDADTGDIYGVSVEADVTVTYIGLKSGLFTGKARDYTGVIEFDDLSVPKEVYRHLEEKVDRKLMPVDLGHILKPRLRCSHKGNHGHVLFIGGAEGMSGAIRLAAEAGLRIGAGLVSIATDISHAHLINLTRPELMVTGVEHPDALTPLINKVSVIVVGPGLGQSAWAEGLLLKVLESNKPKVLDADALNLLSNIDVKRIDGNNWILTPHPAEAARLLGIKTSDIEADRYQSIKKIVKKWGGGCILKGAGSLTYSGSFTSVCTSGNPGMASGGMGDVLSGIVGGLLAQGLSIREAAKLGTQLHAKAADLAAQDGERGLLASDLFPYLRKLVNE